MSDILCLYYSRSGNTRQTMAEIAKALEAEPITVAASQATTLGLVFVFVLPAAVLVAGAVVVLLRRRR